MQYREQLPENCPPDSAIEITEATIRYRLLAGKAPRQEDFDSFIKTMGRPRTRTQRSICEQNGVSLWQNEELARELLDGPINKNNKWQSIGELTIPPGEGKLNPPERSGHQTWWPSYKFDPTRHCRTLT